MERARVEVSSACVWMKAALLERGAGVRQDDRSLLLEGLRRLYRTEKVWYMYGQWHGRANSEAG